MYTMYTLKFLIYIYIEILLPIDTLISGNDIPTYNNNTVNYNYIGIYIMSHF